MPSGSLGIGLSIRLVGIVCREPLPEDTRSRRARVRSRKRQAWRCSLVKVITDPFDCLIVRWLVQKVGEWRIVFRSVAHVPIKPIHQVFGEGFVLTIFIASFDPRLHILVMGFDDPIDIAPVNCRKDDALIHIKSVFHKPSNGYRAWQLGLAFKIFFKFILIHKQG